MGGEPDFLNSALSSSFTSFQLEIIKIIRRISEDGHDVDDVTIQNDDHNNKEDGQHDDEDGGMMTAMMMMMTAMMTAKMMMMTV